VEIADLSKYLPSGAVLPPEVHMISSLRQRSRPSARRTILALGALGLASLFITGCDSRNPARPALSLVSELDRGDFHSHARPNWALIPTGKEIFRFDTFGDEVFWTDTARLNEVIAGGAGGAVGLAAYRQRRPSRSDSRSTSMPCRKA